MPLLYSKTYTFGLCDKGYHIKERISDLSGHSTDIPKELLELHILDIEKTVSLPIKKAIVDAYKLGEIQMFVLDKEFAFPTAVPVILQKDKTANKVVARINVTPFSRIKIDKFGKMSELDIDKAVLVTLMSCAWFYLRWFQNETKIKANVSFIKLMANIYANVMYKIMDSKYSVGSYFESQTKMLVNSAYFFASYFTESTYARDIAKTIPAILDKDVADKASEEIAKLKPQYTGFEDFIDGVNKTVRGMENVKALEYVSEFGRIYGGKIVAAIDYLPFFFMMLISAYVSGKMANDIIIQKTQAKDIDKMLKLVSSIYS